MSSLPFPFSDPAVEERFLARYVSENRDFYLLCGTAIVVFQLAIAARDWIDPLKLSDDVQVLIWVFTLPATLLALVLIFLERSPLQAITKAYAVYAGIVFLLYPFFVSEPFLLVWGFKNLAACLFLLGMFRFRIRFVLTLATSLAATYAILVLLLTQHPPVVLLVHEFTFVSATALGLMVAFLLELNARRHFDEVVHLSRPADADGSAAVFISHAGADRPAVDSIVSFLQSVGYTAWYSTNDIRGASDWQNVIISALEACEWFLLVMSEKSAKSEWVKDELFWAIDNRPDRIIPVVLDDCDPAEFHIRLRRLQVIDFRDAEKGQAEVRRVLAGARQG